MWTDSTTVLQRLHFIDKPPVFVVAKRVTEILELTAVDEWKNVQTVDNPANKGTRGLSAKALLESTWLKGPAFLRTSDWPFKTSHKLIKTKLKKLDRDKGTLRTQTSRDDSKYSECSLQGSNSSVAKVQLLRETFALFGLLFASFAEILW